MNSRVAVNETVNSHKDASPTDNILQAVNPVPVLVCLLDPHAASVAHGLHDKARVS